MTPKRLSGAGAFPDAVDTPAPDTLNQAPLYGALDLGTNSCRMLIAQPKGNQFYVVDSFSKSVQLGAGLEATGRLSRASIKRTIQALRICHRKLQYHGVTRMRLIATEACRRAQNAQEFHRVVKREVGITLEIIKPEEEARDERDDNARGTRTADMQRKHRPNLEKMRPSACSLSATKVCGTDRRSDSLRQRPSS